MNHQALNGFAYSTPVTPEFVERHEQSKPWVYNGADNQYPLYLEDLMMGSAIHSAIIKGVAEMVYAKGLHSEYGDKYVDQVLAMKQMFGDGTCLRRVCYDLKLYGNAYLNVVWNKDRSKIAAVHHVPSAFVRAGVCDDDGKITTFYYSTDWQSTSNDEVRAYPAYSSKDRTAASQMLQIKQYSPVSYYYGVPDYLGSTRYIELDRDISEFHLANIKHGLFPSMIISFNNGVPTEDERVEMERLIYEKFSGANNAGKFLMTFNDSQENAPTIESFAPAEPQKVYQFMSNEISVKILSGHRVTSPLLFGIRDEGGGFGSNADEMRDAYDLFYSTVIKPMQDLILSSIQPLLSANGIVLPTTFGKLIPASFLEEKQEEEPRGPIQFSQDFRIQPEQCKVWLNHLEYKHKPVGPEYTLVRKEIVTSTDVERRLNTRRNFAESESVLESYDNHEEMSDWGDITGPDGTRFALRYQYEQLDSTRVSKTGQSRDFCQKMVALSEDGVMYRYEDIADMSDDGINGEFAAKGTSSYDIFEWKGGVNCYHTWVRLIFAAATDKDPQDLVEEWDEVYKRVGNNPYVPAAGVEAIAPINR